jgi:pyridoxine kinase
MARVLAISSQTVFGPVGNSAAVPALQVRGHEVLQIPTVILSNHPGLGQPAGLSTPTGVIEEIFAALTKLGAFANIDAVLTGYFTSSEQVIAVVKQISILKVEHQELVVLVDPVIGDHGGLYVEISVAEAIRDLLLPLATITTPNVFEVSWLAGTPDVAQAVAAINVAETIVTSVPDGEDLLATQLYTSRQALRHITQKRNQVPHGTGDYLSGCYLAERLKHPADVAFKAAMTSLDQTIARSIGLSALQLNEDMINLE